ncbi:MAG TPA: tetratricopeptide repeat protein [Bryobacteraceae bacterium]|jgi:Tfp pilus assembly protein PilF|nr:tetratricopeptide repeat protein [Bryobacteraceae bacterium]
MRCVACLVAIAAFLRASPAPQQIEGAIAALQRGDTASAERLLRETLKEHPQEADAAGLLAVVLDQQNRAPEATPYYQQALASGPVGSGLLNNYGNHLLLTNQPRQARLQFQKAIAIDPENANARIQLARLALEDKQPSEAATRLNELPPALRDRNDVALLRMRTEYGLGHTDAAADLLQHLLSNAQNDPAALISIGEALSATGRYDEAASVFDAALQIAPNRVDAIYDAGLAASRAGDFARAEGLLKRALELQPNNPDASYDLAVVQVKLGHPDEAVATAAHAAQINPAHRELQSLLARITARLGYFADSAQAWQRYLKLVPGDTSAQREYAFVQTALPERADAGLAGLQAYVRAHPNDPIGHYELGTVQTTTEPEAALKQFSAAIAIKPDLAAVRFARGVLEYRQGRTSAALDDFAAAMKQAPENPAILDHLGQAQLSLGHTDEALATLHRATKLSPDNSTLLFHLGRALKAANKGDEAEAVFARARELGPARPLATQSAGLLDYLALPPEEQIARYRAGVERTARDHPDNVEAQIRLLQLLIDDGKTDDAATLARQIQSLKPPPSLMQEAQRTLLAAQALGSKPQ